MRVRPYYLFQGDVAAGTSHLRTSVETGIEIMQNLRGFVSGLAVPHLVIDTPGGMGKVNIGPDYVVKRGADKWTLRNYEGRLVDYPQPREQDATCAYDAVYFGDTRERQVKTKQYSSPAAGHCVRCLADEDRRRCRQTRGDPVAGLDDINTGGIVQRDSRRFATGSHAGPRLEKPDSTGGDSGRRCDCCPRVSLCTVRQPVGDARELALLVLFHPMSCSRLTNPCFSIYAR